MEMTIFCSLQMLNAAKNYGMDETLHLEDNKDLLLFYKKQYADDQMLTELEWVDDEDDVVDVVDEDEGNVDLQLDREEDSECVVRMKKYREIIHKLEAYVKNTSERRYLCKCGKPISKIYAASGDGSGTLVCAERICDVGIVVGPTPLLDENWERAEDHAAIVAEQAEQLNVEDIPNIVADNEGFNLHVDKRFENKWEAWLKDLEKGSEEALVPLEPEQPPLDPIPIEAVEEIIETAERETAERTTSVVTIENCNCGFMASYVPPFADVSGYYECAEQKCAYFKGMEHNENVVAFKNYIKDCDAMIEAIKHARDIAKIKFEDFGHMPVLHTADFVTRRESNIQFYDRGLVSGQAQIANGQRLVYFAKPLDNLDNASLAYVHPYGQLSLQPSTDDAMGYSLKVVPRTAASFTARRFKAVRKGVINTGGEKTGKLPYIERARERKAKSKARAEQQDDKPRYVHNPNRKRGCRWDDPDSPYVYFVNRTGSGSRPAAAKRAKPSSTSSSAAAAVADDDADGTAGPSDSGEGTR